MSSCALAIAKVAAAFPGKAFPDTTAALYGRMLADLDPEAVDRAVDRLLNASDFMPTIHAIKREVAEEALALPTPEEAWDIALMGDLKHAPPELRGAVTAVGGRWALLHSDHPPTVRAQFLKSYIERRANAVSHYIGAKQPHAIESSLDLKLGSGERLGQTMRALPESEFVHAPPVHARWLRRMSGRELEAPTEAEKAHAIEVLHDGPPIAGEADPIYVEAERIFIEAGVR